MQKILLSIILTSSICFASMINAIAILVNDEPITLYDIDEAMDKNKISKNEAASYLIDKKLYEQLIKTYGISVNIFEINSYIENLANSNGMSLYDFKDIIKQEYPNYEIFENEAKETILKQKLVKALVKGQLAIANDEDMKLFYEKNTQKYLTSKTFNVVQYSSSNKETLFQFMQNPIIMPRGVTRQNINFNQSNIEPQLQYLLTATKENTFTPIFTSNRQYVTFFILKKEGSANLAFEIVKNKVFNDIMLEREENFLKDYFERQKLIAKIKVLR